MAGGKVEKWLGDSGLALVAGWARQGLDRQAIARKMEIATSTLYRWEKENKGLADALCSGHELANVLVEDALYQRALAGDMRAITFWLRNRAPERWQDSPDAKSGQVVNIIDDL